MFGQDFDICHVIAPVDLAAGANTGARIHLQNYGAVTFVAYLATGTAGQAPTITLQEHTAASGGTSQDLAVVTEYFFKEEATLDGDETWTRATQTAAATVTDADWDDANQVMVAFTVHYESLTEGYGWLSVNIADPGTAHVGAVLAIADRLRYKNRPDRLADPNT